MYRLLENDFHFVATYSRNPTELKGGEDYCNRPYCILASESKEAKSTASDLNKKSDVCVFGAGNLDYVVERSKTGKLSFEVSERWLKKGYINYFSPRLLQWWWIYQTRLRKKPFYKLCASAFAAQDDKKMGCYEGKHFKWGYFTEIPSNLKNFSNLKRSETIKLMWCARFIDWKHPELAIECAHRLKHDGYRFQLDMYGDGPLRLNQECWVRSNGLEDVVFFHGNVPNAEVKIAMRNSDIFLFTSDKQEGWGAVANESMAGGCCLVGSDEIGSIPYLIRNRRNGLVFKSKLLSDLYEKVKYLLDNPDQREQMASQGYNDVGNLWSPQRAAENLLQLIKDLQQQTDISIVEGPCSKA